MTRTPAWEEASDDAGPPEDREALTREVRRLRDERDHLLAHSRNLEAELRCVRREPVRVRDLERRLAAAEALLRRVSFVRTARWLLLEPDAALRRVYRRLRDGVGFRLHDRWRRFWLGRRRFGK